jgi:hypothetical protein
MDKTLEDKVKSLTRDVHALHDLVRDIARDTAALRNGLARLVEIMQPNAQPDVPRQWVTNDELENLPPDAQCLVCPHRAGTHLASGVRHLFHPC